MRQRREMARMEATVFILQEMEMLDQEIALAWLLAQKRLHLGKRSRLDLPPLRHIAAATSARARTETPLAFLPRRAFRHLSLSAR
jgi:hypothetical protein